MIVCFCRGLSESDLRRVVAAGAWTVEEVSGRVRGRELIAARVRAW